MLGTSLNTQENRTHSYVRNTKEMLRIIGARFFSPLFKNETLFLMFSKQKEKYLQLTENLKKFTEGIIRKSLSSTQKQETISNENEYGIKKRSSLMGLLINELSRNGSIDFEGVREEIDTFLISVSKTNLSLTSLIITLTH